MSGEASGKKVKRFADCDRSADFDAATQKALEEIDQCQNDIDKINEKASVEILVIEQKYNQVRKPCYDRRSEVISTIPNFWVTAITNHPDLGSLLEDGEENCLHHLTKIDVQEFDDIKSGYFIKFYFEENPYFENAVLTKEYHFDCHSPRSESTLIVWKEGCSLGPGGENSKNPRKRRHEPTKTFFTWFSDNVDPYTDDIAEVIKDDLWLNPLQYYLVPDMEGEGDNGTDDDGSSSSDQDQEESKDDDSKGGSALSESIPTRSC